MQRVSMSNVKASDIAYVSFTAPDLTVMKLFLQDFGLVVAHETATDLFMKGHGEAPFIHHTRLGSAGFAALAFRVESMEELATLAAASGTAIQGIEAPGEGHSVQLRDPDGFRIEAIAGQESGAPLAKESRQAWNSTYGYSRLGKTTRIAKGPSHVHRLGHCVLAVTNFRRSEAWYKSHFGLITSDEIITADKKTPGAFLRFDRGETPTDHHSLFLVERGGAPAFLHAAFEVRDLDDLMVGHDHLKRQARTAEWGIGRHVLGSQVFDYWQDPWAHTLEHWTDGDLLTKSSGSQIATEEELLGVQWGPGFPR
jgi:catechol 2,3-dioxygenase-like lactoylglutathione lyase family enzyme